MVLEGLIDIVDIQEIKYDRKQEPKERFTEPSEIETSDHLVELYGKFKGILLANLPPENIQVYIDELEACPNIHKLKYTARKIAIKLKLTMNTSVGEALLDLLD